MVLLSSALSSLIFRLLDLSICNGGMLRAPVITVDASISPCGSTSFCFRYFDALLLGAFMLRMAMSPKNWSLYHYVKPFFIPDNML